MLTLGKKTKKKQPAGSQINIVNFITLVTMYFQNKFLILNYGNYNQQHPIGNYTIKSIHYTQNTFA